MKNIYFKNYMQNLRGKLKAGKTLLVPVKPKIDFVKPSVKPKNQIFRDEIEEMKQIYITEQLRGESTYADKNRRMNQRIEDITHKDSNFH